MHNNMIEIIQIPNNKYDTDFIYQRTRKNRKELLIPTVLTTPNITRYLT